MTVTTHRRGHVTEWRGDQFVYADTGEPADHDRPCIRCGRGPTPEGHDACLGHIPGANSVCCGHGVHDPIFVFWGERLACLSDDALECAPGHREWCFLCDEEEERCAARAAMEPTPAPATEAGA